MLGIKIKMDKVCCDCKFWGKDFSEQADGERLAPCRRFPPTRVGAGESVASFDFPYTSEHAWCGEYRAMPSEAPAEGLISPRSA